MIRLLLSYTPSLKGNQHIESILEEVATCQYTAGSFTGTPVFFFVFSRIWLSFGRCMLILFFPLTGWKHKLWNRTAFSVRTFAYIPVEHPGYLQWWVGCAGFEIILPRTLAKIFKTSWPEAILSFPLWLVKNYLGSYFIPPKKIHLLSGVSSVTVGCIATASFYMMHRYVISAH